MQFEFFVQFLEGFIDAELTGIISKDGHEAGELTGAAGAQSPRCVPEWGEIDAPEIFHHLRTEHIFFVESAPSLRAQSSGALVGIGVADMDKRFELALGVGNERGEEVGFVIRREAIEYVVELDGAGRSAPFRPVDVIL
jgi:hypothetical protein